MSRKIFATASLASLLFLGAGLSASAQDVAHDTAKAADKTADATKDRHQGHGARDRQGRKVNGPRHRQGCR